MKILILLFVSTFAFGQNIKYKSTNVQSGSGPVRETHIIQVKYGRTDKDVDTLLIDNYKIYCLHDGECGEEIAPKTNKFKYYSRFIRVINTRLGRVVSGRNFDYNSMIEVWHAGDAWDNKKITKVIVRIHGMVTGYYN